MAGSDMNLAIERRRPFALEAPLGGFRPLDWLVAGYASAASLALLVGAVRGAPRALGWLLVDLAILAGLFLVVRLTRDSRSAALTFLRLSYGPFLLLVFFTQVEVIWPIFWRHPLDGLVAATEDSLFGRQPALTFAAVAPSTWLSELFCFAYLSYYFFLPAVALTLLFRRGYGAAERALFATTACFLSCYAFFWVFPSVGPHFWFPPHSGPQLYDGWLFDHLLFFLTSRGEIHGGAFPSSHIAVAVLLTVYVRREIPRLFPLLLTITILICPAVVYLRAHYALDALVGAPVGLFFARSAGLLETARRRARQAA